MAYNVDSLIWQIFFAISMFLSTFISYLLPIIIFTRKNGRLCGSSSESDQSDEHHHNWNNDPVSSVPVQQRKKHRWKRWLSYCNCLSAGVFIGVCFLNLVPCVEDEFSSLIHDYPELKNFFGNFPLGQFTVILGLFLVLFLENILSNCFEIKQKNNQNKRDDLEYPVLYLDEEIVSETTPHDDQEQELLLNCGIDQSSSSPTTIIGVQANDRDETRGNLGSQEETTIENHRPNNGHNHHHHDHHHGHHHLDVGSMAARTNDSMFSFFLLMFATSVHSLFEGMALGLQTDIKTAIHLFIGIILHECLVAVALGLNAVRLQQEQIRMRTHLKFAFVFSITIPFGSILGVLLGYTPGHIGRFISAIFQGIAAGTFIHVTFFELVPEEFILSDSAATIKQHNHGCDNNEREMPTGEDVTTSDPSVSLTTTTIRDEPNEKINQQKLRLKKISLLLVGFLIMALVPFIFPE